MILSIRQYPEDLFTEGDHDGDSSQIAVLNARHDLEYHYEYIVDLAAVESSKHVITKRKGPKLHTQEKVLAFVGGFSKIFLELFLPLGYPHSVDPSYLPYQLYDGLQGLCSYWRGVVATQAVLTAAGVGNAQISAASAAVQWALRDGTGMMGGLVFSYVASRYFDTHVKEFRLFADVINDVALTLDMLAPHVESDWSLWILCLSTIGKTLCGMSAGATKGRITQHFSRHGNMADLSAKESTQETLVSLLGMVGGVAVAQLLQSVPYFFTWIMFGILTVVHVWANYKGVKVLKLATLNQQRTLEVFKDLLLVLMDEQGDQELSNALDDIPTPEQIDESLFWSTKKLLFPTVHVDTPINVQHFEFANEFANEKYIIGVKNQHIYIHLCLTATTRDELTAFLHALLLQQVSACKNLRIDANLIKK